MTKKKEMNVGLVIKDEDADNETIKGLYKEIESLGSVEIDKLITHWGRYNNINLYVYIIHPLSSKEKSLLLTTLLSNQFNENMHKIKISFVYESKYKEICLNLFCECNKHGITSDVIRKEDIMFDEKVVGAGDVLDFIKIYYDVDALKIERTDYGYVPIELSSELQKNGYVPEKFWYWHEESSILWQKLISPKSGYELTEITTELLNTHIKDILKIMFEKVQGNVVEFIDLGVGTPKKDEIIITNMMKKLSKKSKINFFPIDISFPLIEYTLRSVLYIKKDSNVGPFLDIIPIVGDFEKLNVIDYQTLLGEDRPKLISLLGNTLGNVIEGKIFRTLSKLMGKKGYLLIDVEYSDAWNEELIKAQYETQTMYDFVFHPLELLGYEKETYDKRMIVKMVEIKEDIGSEGTISYNYGKGQEQPVTNIPKSKVVSMCYRTDNNKEILMAWSTKYHSTSFDSFLKNHFEIAEKWLDTSGRYGLYLLKNM